MLPLWRPPTCPPDRAAPIPPPSAHAASPWRWHPPATLVILTPCGCSPHAVQPLAEPTRLARRKKTAALVSTRRLQAAARRSREPVACPPPCSWPLQVVKPSCLPSPLLLAPAGDQRGHAPAALSDQRQRGVARRPAARGAAPAPPRHGPQVTDERLRVRHPVAQRLPRASGDALPGDAPLGERAGRQVRGRAPRAPPGR